MLARAARAAAASSLSSRSRVAPQPPALAAALATPPSSSSSSPPPPPPRHHHHRSPCCAGAMESVTHMLRAMSARLKSSVAGPPESMQRMAAAEASAPPLPENNISFWVESTREQAQALHTTSEPLLDVDVAVLGGGIVGITTAYLLRKAGLKARVRCDSRARARRCIA
jgi:hypothetical protein